MECWGGAGTHWDHWDHTPPLFSTSSFQTHLIHSVTMMAVVPCCFLCITRKTGMRSGQLIGSAKLPQNVLVFFSFGNTLGGSFAVVQSGEGLPSPKAAAFSTFLNFPHHEEYVKCPAVGSAVLPQRRVTVPSNPLLCPGWDPSSVVLIVLSFIFTNIVLP